MLGMTKSLPKVPNITAARLRYVTRHLPKVLHSNFGLFGFIFEMMFVQTPLLQNQVASALKVRVFFGVISYSDVCILNVYVAGSCSSELGAASPV